MKGFSGTVMSAKTLVHFNSTLYRIAMKDVQTKSYVRPNKAGRSSGKVLISDETVWSCYLLRDLGITAESIAKHLNLKLNTVNGFINGRTRSGLLAKYEMNIPMSQAIRYY